LTRRKNRGREAETREDKHTETYGGRERQRKKNRLIEIPLRLRVILIPNKEIHSDSESNEGRETKSKEVYAKRDIGRHTDIERTTDKERHADVENMRT